MVGETGEIVDFKKHGDYYLVKMRFRTVDLREEFIYNYAKGKKEELLFDDYNMSFVIKSINWQTSDCREDETWIQISKYATDGMGAVLAKRKVKKKKRFGKLRKKEEIETDEVFIEDTFVTIRDLTVSTYGPGSDKSLEVKAPEVRCSGCNTSLGYADDIMYPIGTKEDICYWCKEKVTMTDPRLDLRYKEVPFKTIIKDRGYKDIIPPKKMVEFAPPEPETNICPLCGDTIPDDTLRSPRILCGDCRRPIACPSCKEEILKPVGITECPWCRTDSESTEKIKHSLRVRQEKETYEKELVKPSTGKLLEGFATYRTDQATDFPVFGEGTPYSTLSHAIAGLEDQDQYPHRNGPDAMSRKGGWGAPFDIPNKSDILSRIKEPMKSAVLEREEYLKEEAQRGTGRSTQRRLSAMNHLYHRESGKFYMNRKVLIIVDTQRNVKETRGALEDLYVNRYNLGSGVFETIFTKYIHIMTIRNAHMRDRHGYTLIVLDLVVPMEKMEAKRLRMGISIHACPIIGGESIVETEDPEPEPGREAEGFNTFGSGFQPKVIIGDEEIPVTDVTYTVDQDVQPVYSPGERKAVITRKGPTKVEGTFKGVMATKIAETVPELESLEAQSLGYAIGPPNDDGIIGVMRDTGKISVRLVNTDKEFKPGDLVTIDDVYSPNDPIMQQPVGTTARKSRKEKPPRSARRKMAEPSQSLIHRIGGGPTKWWKWVILTTLTIPAIFTLLLLWLYTR